MALPGDGAALTALHGESFDTGWDDKTIEDFIASDLVLVSVSAVSGAINGFIIIRHLSDEAEVLSLCVQQTARQIGVGSALLATSVDHLMSTGVQKLFLEVAEDNLAALQLYNRAGFAQIGLRKAYYARRIGPAINALVMSLSIGANEIAPTR